ncbi:anoctamin-7-like isoform X2 [Paramacrobiotus metropolitanus]|uniref:anoctamin-7-like isoform X2 n=1 Tax=Paramacrobiotus metropolitanus TaxID=2943436 RepID=UPI002446446E|nr:anoctamin-7-like isoform X2 [Paramacrobiotus metropolitanus]
MGVRSNSPFRKWMPQSGRHPRRRSVSTASRKERREYQYSPLKNEEFVDPSPSQATVASRWLYTNEGKAWVTAKPPADKKSVVQQVNVDVSTMDTESLMDNDRARATYFNDGQRPIDFVLVYEIKRHHLEALNPYQIDKRERFLRGVEETGMQLEKMKAMQKAGHISTFVKIHCPWDILQDWAEKLRIPAPLQEAPGIVENWSQKVLQFLKIPSDWNIMAREVPHLPVHYYTAQFRADRLQHYVFKDDPTKLFSRSQRSYIVSEILQTVVYGDERKGQMGLPRLLSEGVFQAAFPLHDGPLDAELTARRRNAHSNQRQILRDHWADFKCFFRYQPIGHIRSYFGEQITLYFAWLGLYTGWLIPLALVGIAAFLYGIVTIPEDPIVQEVCNKGEHYRMCPVCDNCPYWQLKEACGGKKIGYLFDNYGTCVHAFFISLWSVMLVEFWKRKNAELTHFFDCDDLQEEIEHPRAAFTRFAPMMKRNVVTGQLEPFVPRTTLILRRLTSWIASISFVLLIFLVTFGVILIRTQLRAELIRKYGLSSLHAKIAGPVATLVNLATILALNYVYVYIAAKLTEWEMYRTQREHEESLAWKAYWFQFVNVFAPMFYLAFVKGRFIGSPGHYRRVAGMMLETCDIGGCFAELGVQLIITMCGKQIICNIAEYVYPMLQRTVKIRRGRILSTTELNATFLDQQYKLLPYMGLTGEYMETVIQFGFIVLFGAAFPLGALVSLLSNIFEIRLDAHKLIVNCRRPLALRARSIGIWLHVLRWMTVLSAFLIAFTSDTLAETLYAIEHKGSMVGYINHSLAITPVGVGPERCRYESFRNIQGDFNKFYYELTVLRLSFVLIYVATVYGICTIISYMIPDIPKHVLDARKRRRFLADQALQSTPAAANEAYQRVKASIQENPMRIKPLKHQSKFKMKAKNYYDDKARKARQ